MHSKQTHFSDLISKACVVSTYIMNIHRDKHIWTIKTFVHGLCVQWKLKGNFSKLYSSRGLKSSNDGVQGWTQFKKTEILSLRPGKKLKKSTYKVFSLPSLLCGSVKPEYKNKMSKYPCDSKKFQIFFKIFLKSFLRVCHNPKVSECIESVLTNRFYGPFD